MKVILNQDVPKIGRKYETHDVADGFAHNYLLPRKLADFATKEAIARVSLAKSLHDEQLQLNETGLIKQLKKLSESEIKLVEKANEKGHLFAGIHAEELQTAIKEQVGIDMPVTYIVLAKPIKEVGEHTVQIVIQDKKSSLKVMVSSPEGTESE